MVAPCQLCAPASLNTPPIPTSPPLRAVVTHELWLSLCVSLHPAIAHAAANIDASAVPEHRTSGGAAVAAAVEQSAEAAGAAASASAAPTAAASRPSRSPSPLPGLPPSQAVRRSAFFKRLSHSLRAPLARESLVAAALGASSTDHPQASCLLSACFDGLHGLALLAVRCWRGMPCCSHAVSGWFLCHSAGDGGKCAGPIRYLQCNALDAFLPLHTPSEICCRRRWRMCWTRLLAAAT